ncbi:hypothetical protein DIPPA_33016 [Diplonema papillatum]|nr:hypothetical protein DIPPA_33016 [Diplonema papillatum]|eukprot:gene5736-8777_t
MAKTSGCDKLISLFAELDDGGTGFIPTAVVKALLCEVGEKMNEPDWAAIEGDMCVDGMFPYKWYFEEILCNHTGIGDYHHWLKMKA